MNSTE